MERNAFFDNAKLVLIFLVVFGHLIRPAAQESAFMHTLYIWIYTFHMPAFIFLSGFFAKGAGNKQYIANLAKKLLLPYLIFQGLYTVFYYLIGKSSWKTSIFEPQWALWFLFSLFSWHLLLILFKKLPPVSGVALAAAIGLGVGYFPEIGAAFSLSRTFVFFPFFLAGYWLTSEQLMMLKRPSIKLAGVAIMAGMAIAIYAGPEWKTGWLLASKSYADLGMPVMGSLARLLVYGAAVLMSASVLAWVPRQRVKLTNLGARTLYVYLLHGFFIQSFRQADMFVAQNLVDMAAVILIAAALVLLLSSKPVLRLWRPFIEMKGRMFKNQYNHYSTH